MILLAVLSGFALAIMAPWLTRVLRRFSGWTFSLLPASLFLWFCTHLGDVSAGKSLRAGRTWAPLLNVNLEFMLDGLSLLFVLLISGIGALILIYSQGYLGGHPQLGRFYCFILMFMGSMLGLVLADNVLTMYVFWELTSVSSYLLIGFEHESADARYAALQALLVTSMGGLCLLAGLLLLGQAEGSYQFSTLLSQPGAFSQHPFYLPTLMLVLAGAFTKSAQFPFYFWLPSAMQAPTPVSAFLHSATMVKAGVYLLARLSPVLGGTEIWTGAVAVTGAMTMLAGAYLALRHTDLKLMLAYSTVSVLGLLVMALGIGTDEAVRAATVYVLAHALYKGTLFLVAGAVEHETGMRDVRKLSGLRRFMPVTASAAALGALSMAGVPPFSGFAGKELVYEAVLHSPFTRWLTTASVAASALLATTAFAVGFKPFFGPANNRRSHEAPASLWLGPALLALAGLLLAIVPNAGINELLTAAASAVRSQAIAVDLAVWHGTNLSLILTAATLAAGLTAYAWWRRRYDLTLLPSAVEQWGPSRWYEVALKGLNWVATTQTRAVQSGYLRFYVLTTIFATTLLAGYPLIFRSSSRASVTLRGADFYQIALAILMLMAALVATQAKSLMAAITALGVVGYGVTLLFVFFAAPDLAITQLLVETLVVILFILVVYRMPHYSVLSAAKVQVRDAVVSVAGGILMTLLVLAAAAVPPRDVSDFFAQASVPQAHGRNIVNVILVDFRSLDTMGEITVLAIASLGVFGLLRLGTRNHEEGP